jgi:hypothetical protein
MKKWPLLLYLLVLSVTGGTPAEAQGVFHRIVDGPHPSARQEAIDRYTYGADVLYTGDVHGDAPKPVTGVVWHSNLAEGRYFRGDRNPVIDQESTLKLIEDNKWEESKLLMKYLPDVFPRTENLGELLSSLGLSRTAANLPAIEAALRARYPEGFFLKPSAGFNSAGTFPTETTDFASLYSRFSKNVRPKIETMSRNHDATDVHLALKDTPDYSGRVLQALLEDPRSVIIQAKISPAVGATVRAKDGHFKTLVEEYRVHVVEGEVLVGGTQNRWEDARSLSRSDVAQVEQFVSEQLERLPDPLRKMCFGMDVMRTSDGGFKIIELNAGGESGYLYPETDIWVTQLLARRYGGPAPLLREFDAIRALPTLQAKEGAFGALLGSPELRALAKEVEPVTELLAQAKDLFLTEVRASPTRENAFVIVPTLRKFALEHYLTNEDIELLANALGGFGDGERGGGGQAQLLAAANDLGLGDGEFLFVGEDGRARVLNGLDYDDAAAERKLADLAMARLGRSGAPESEIRAAAEEILERKAVTREELAENPVEDPLARRIADVTEESGARLVLGAARSEALEAVVRTLAER